MTTEQKELMRLFEAHVENTKRVIEEGRNLLMWFNEEQYSSVDTETVLELTHNRIMNGVPSGMLVIRNNETFIAE